MTVEISSLLNSMILATEKRKTKEEKPRTSMLRKVAKTEDMFTLRRGHAVYSKE